MKAKDLKIGDPVYRAETDKIKVARVIGLNMVAGGIKISLSGYYDDKIVKPDAEAIIPENPASVRYYFDLRGAQIRQLRLRYDKIEAGRANLEKAAQLYAETLAKYKDVPPTEPVPVEDD